MNCGDVVFFKRAKSGTNRKNAEVEFKGHGFGLLLGLVPPFAKEPPLEHIRRLLATVGFISFDDVGDFLGDEAGAKCVQMFEEKYYGVKPEDAARIAAEKEKELISLPPIVEAPKPETPKLVGIDGKPIQ